jgi:YD repeat-containing protein
MSSKLSKLSCDLTTLVGIDDRAHAPRLAQSYGTALRRRNRDRSLPRQEGVRQSTFPEHTGDPHGLPVAPWQLTPIFASSTARSAATTTAALFTTTSYDGLKRSTSVATAVGTTTFAYSPWQTRVSDPNGKLKDLVRDAYANLASVIEYNTGETYTTSYSYDALQNLTSITDALQNVRNFSYDGLSRRLTAQDLHDAADGTFGTNTYAYDLAGNIASTTDPLGQVVSYAYDALNRVRTEDYAGASGTEVTYVYDGCTYGKGKLCSASSTNAYTSNAYNAIGLLSAEGKRINSLSYATTSFAYDRQGNVASTTYPNGREVAYGHDLGGRIADIKTKPYDDLNRLVSASTTAASSTPFSETYRYNAIGNLSKAQRRRLIRFQTPTPSTWNSAASNTPRSATGARRGSIFPMH